MEYTSIALPPFSQILLRRWRLILLMMIVSLATTIVVTDLLPIKYTATATLIIDFNPPADVDSQDFLSPLLQPNYMATQVGIIQSHHVALRVVDKFKLADNTDRRAKFIEATDGQGDIRNWLGARLLADLAVEADDKSRLVTVSYTAAGRQFAAAVANAFATEYDKTNLELSVNPARKSAELLSNLLVDLRAKLDQAQSNLSQHQRTHNIFAVDEKLDIETARLTELSSRLVALQESTRESESQLRQVHDLQPTGRSLDALPQLLSNSFVQHLKTELGNKEAKLEQMSIDVGKQHPQYQSLSAEVQTLRSALARETAIVVAGIKDRVEQTRSLEHSLTDAVDRQKTKVMELKTVRDQVPALTREVESAQSDYRNALAQYNQSTVQSHLNQTNVTILNPAQVPVTPSFPNWKINIALSIVLGAIVALVTILLLEVGRYKRAEEKAVSRTARIATSGRARSLERLEGGRE
ncbi:MAG: GNVR domain-containing protein [Chromatiales bacterium]